MTHDDTCDRCVDPVTLEAGIAVIDGTTYCLGCAEAVRAEHARPPRGRFGRFVRWLAADVHMEATVTIHDTITGRTGYVTVTTDRRYLRYRSTVTVRYHDTAPITVQRFDAWTFTESAEAARTLSEQLAAEVSNRMDTDPCP